MWIRHGRGRIYESKERRKYHDEEPDGFLYRNRGVLSARLQPLCGDGKFVGWGLNLFTNFGETDWSAFVFNLVFCATAATIVSGAMAERTKFITYCIYSFIISLCVYPIEAHWVWGGTPWLTDMGSTDFAGSACIHMVGGITAFIGAAMLGPRIENMTRTASRSLFSVTTC